MRIDGEKKKKNKAKRKPVNYHWTVFVRKNKYRLIQSLDNTCALKQVRRAISETAQLRRSANDCKILLPFSFFLFFFFPLPNYARTFLLFSPSFSRVGIGTIRSWRQTASDLESRGKKREREKSLRKFSGVRLLLVRYSSQLKHRTTKIHRLSMGMHSQ